MPQGKQVLGERATDARPQLMPGDCQPSDLHIVHEYVKHVLSCWLIRQVKGIPEPEPAICIVKRLDTRVL